jgi:hypothetical protein
MNFIIRYKVYGSIVMKADNKEEVQEKFHELSETTISDNCGFDAPEIDDIE